MPTGGCICDGEVFLTGTTLNNYGAATWDASDFVYGQGFFLGDSAVFNNLAGASFAAVGRRSPKRHRRPRQFGCCIQ